METGLRIPPKRKCILVLTSTFPRWLGDREPPFIFELSKRLANQFDVIVLAPHACGSRFREKFGLIDVRRFRYFFSPYQKLTYDGGILANLKRQRLNYFLVPFFFIAEFIQVIKLLRNEKIDAIHAHWLIPQGAIALAARLFTGRSPAIICTSHGGDLFGLSDAIFTAMKRQIIRHCEKTTVVSEAMRTYAESISERRDIDVISMGVDLIDQFTPDYSVVRAPNEILFAGRLVEKKGVCYALLAMPTILRSFPATRLTIAGDGPDRTQLEELANKIGITGHVSFVGALDSVALRDRYRRATLFVAPSVVARNGDQEGLGLVFVEALGCECAVVATDLPAIRDVIVDGVTGLVCKQKNSEDLASKVIALLEDARLRATLGQNGRQHVLSRFDWHIIAEKYAKLISATV